MTLAGVVAHEVHGLGSRPNDFEVPAGSDEVGLAGGEFALGGFDLDGDLSLAAWTLDLQVVLGVLDDEPAHGSEGGDDVGLVDVSLGGSAVEAHCGVKLSSQSAAPKSSAIRAKSSQLGVRSIMVST